jgi:hypothetical protein
VNGDRTIIGVGVFLAFMTLAFAHWAMLVWLSPKRLDEEGRRTPMPGRTFLSLWTDHDPSNYSQEVRQWIWPLRGLFILSIGVFIGGSCYWMG